MKPSIRRHRQVAVPAEHGAWAMYLSPLLVGLAAGQRVSVVTAYLVVAATAGFLMRQPLTMWVKVRSGRRSAEYARPALLWTCLFAGIAGLHVVGLVLRGFSYLLWLALPGMGILVWHLTLIARRKERQQLLIEIVGTAFLALTAPAAMWVGRGTADPRGWALYALVTAHSVWSVQYAYLRLAQRAPGRGPVPRGRGVLLTAGLGLVAAGAGAALGWVPWLTPLAFLPQPLETIRGVSRPATGLRPKQIGLAMLAVTVLHTLLFASAWCLA